MDIVYDRKTIKPDRKLKVIIAGGRDFTDEETFYRVVAGMFLDWDIPLDQLMIVSGQARGADSLGEHFGRKYRIQVHTFPAQWGKYDKKAGNKRNVQMAKYADILIAFWDGESSGTKHMIKTAIKKRLEVHVFDYSGKKLDI